MLRKYFVEWSVPRDVSRRIQQFLEHVVRQRHGRIQFRDVTLLQELSGPLYSELMESTMVVHLRSHAFFRACETTASAFTKSLAHLDFARGDSVFSAGEAASKMYVVLTGELFYTLGEEVDTEMGKSGNERGSVLGQRAITAESEIVTVGQQVSEPVLWVSWLHVGDFLASSACQFIGIDSESFGQSIWQRRSFWVEVRQYAEEFANQMNAILPHELTDLTYKIIDPDHIINATQFNSPTPWKFRKSKMSRRTQNQGFRSSASSES